MPEQAICPECGQPLAPSTLEGLCPTCSLRRALASRTPASSAGTTSSTPGDRLVAEDLTGSTLGHCQLLTRVGVGGMGIVYRARDTHLDRLVAVKVLPPDKVADPHRRRRFVEEAKAASALKHPNIVIIHDIAEADGRYFMVMEFVEGKTLSELIGPAGLPLDQALNYAVQIAGALAQAHAAGIVHRDLKPRNIMVEPDGRVKLVDFGLAKLLERPVVTDGTQPGQILGTLAYMSPEQIEGGKLDGRSDLFAFGAVLHEMLTGRKAFARESRSATVAAIRREDPPPLSTVPSDIAALVSRCLRKSPGDRFQNASEVLSALLAARAAAGVTTRVPCWRPAVGQRVPGTPCRLEAKLGEGRFGEAWLGRDEGLKEPRVFKFCFRPDHVHALKRETTLFRMLRQRAGEHPHLVRVYGVNLDGPPFFVEEEYLAGRDLRTWCAAEGGAGRVPIEVRLEIVAQVAEALQVAHDAGILHRDVKPSNILLVQPGQDRLAVKLTDFGVGKLLAEEAVDQLTREGSTETAMVGPDSARSGTLLYLAPELLAGQSASIQSDVFSLGVVLYQLVVGDLRRPLTVDWAEAVGHEGLERTLHRCIAGAPEKRFPNAGQLAKELRWLIEQEGTTLHQAGTFGHGASWHRFVARAGATALAVLGAAIVTLALWPALDRIERTTYDWRSRLAFRHQQVSELIRLWGDPAENLAVVVVDDQSIAEIRRSHGFAWPWPRQLFGRVVREAVAQGAAAVAIDVPFRDRHADPTEPSVRLPDGTSLGSDAFFARQLHDAGNVILVCPIETRGNQTTLAEPAAIFRTNAQGLAFTSIERDADGVLRRLRPFVDDPARGRVWHFSIRLAAAHLQLDLERARVEARQIVIPGPGAVSRTIPLDRAGKCYIDWSLDGYDRRLRSMAPEEILESDQKRQNGDSNLVAALKNRLVVVGSVSRLGAGPDVGPTPIHRETYLASTHWNALYSILTNRLVRCPSRWEHGAYLAGFGVLGAILAGRFRRRGLVVAVLLLTTAHVALSAWLFVRFRYWAPMASPVAVACLTVALFPWFRRWCTRQWFGSKQVESSTADAAPEGGVGNHCQL